MLPGFYGIEKIDIVDRYYERKRESTLRRDQHLQYKIYLFVCIHMYMYLYKTHKNVK